MKAVSGAEYSVMPSCIRRLRRLTE